MQNYCIFIIIDTVIVVLHSNTGTKEIESDGNDKKENTKLVVEIIFQVK